VRVEERISTTGCGRSESKLRAVSFELRAEKIEMLSDTSPPWRGEIEKHTALRLWGGLLSSEQNPEECDATKMIREPKAGPKVEKRFAYFHFRANKNNQRVF
jgi:hypothetical protein